MATKEPLLCRDCGIDTTPCTGKRGCRHIGRWEFYMVHDGLWRQAGGRPRFMHGGGIDREDILCVGCLEVRLGRPLTAGDFTDAPVNEALDWDTPRLAAAKVAY